MHRPALTPSVCIDRFADFVDAEQGVFEGQKVSNEEEEEIY